MPRVRRAGARASAHLYLCAFVPFVCCVCFVHLAAMEKRAFAHDPDDELPRTPVLTAPVLLEKVAPVYPEAARLAGIGGTVSLEIAVNPDGTVGEIKVVHGPGFGLDEAAVAAALTFRFRPATDHGKPIASTVLFDQVFVVRAHLTAEVEAVPSPPPDDAPVPATRAETPLESRADYSSTVEARGATSAASSTSVRNLDFDLRPKTSPNDILRVVPGLLAVQHQGGGKADQLFLRGFDADHGTDVAVYVDGVPVNMPSHAHGQGFADLHWLIPEAVDRIDVTKGPYDPRWGDFATAGAVNLVTKKDFPESSAAITLGSFPTESGRALATQRFVGIVAPVLGESLAKLHTWIAFEATHDDGPFVNPEGLDRYNLFAKLSYDLSPSTTIGVFAEAYGSQWLGSGQIPEREVAAGRLSQFGAIDPSEGGITERQMLTAFLRHKSADDELTVTTYVTRYRLSLWDDFTFFLGDPVNASEIEQDDRRLFGGLKIAYHVHRHWRGVSFQTSAGAESRYDDIHVDRWDAESQNGDFRKRLGRHVDTSEFGFSASNSDITTIDISGWAEEDVIFNRHLRVIGGLRADYLGFDVADLGESLGAHQPNTSGTQQKAVLSPKLTAVITPAPDVFEVYLNFGEGFHSNMAPVALLDGKTFTNSDGSSFTVHAVPKIYGGELGARLHLGSRVDLAGALWASYLENETVFDADHATFAPADATRRIGVDLEARVQIVKWLYFDYDLAQASATAAPDHGNGGAVALAPRLYMTGGLTAKRGGLRGALRVRYLGPRPAFDETSPEYQYFMSRTLPSGAPNPDYNPAAVNTEGYTIVDAYVAYRWRFLEAQLSVQNLLNSTWREAQFGNHSCTRDETYNPANPNYAGSGNQLSDGTFANRCGITFGSQRSGVTDVHFTPGVPLNLQLTLKAYF